MKERRGGGDRAAACFMRYARYGFHRTEETGLARCERIRRCTAGEREAGEMMAVSDTLRLLRFLGRTDTEDAVRAVYFAHRGRRFRRRELGERIRRFAFERHWDERTVYRRLSEAKRLFTQLAEEGEIECRMQSAECRVKN